MENKFGLFSPWLLKSQDKVPGSLHRFRLVQSRVPALRGFLKIGASFLGFLIIPGGPYTLP